MSVCFYATRLRMVVIWYAIGLYIVGIAVVLYIRPAIMFQPGGIWKEFGISKRDDYSVFPFWLFTIVWAVFSYALATLISILLASVVLRSSDHTPQVIQESAQTFIKPISASTPELSTSSFPATNLFTSPSGPTRVPGYYVLESAVNQPRYVYWGPEPPRFN